MERGRKRPKMFLRALVMILWNLPVSFYTCCSSVIRAHSLVVNELRWSLGFPQQTMDYKRVYAWSSRVSERVKEKENCCCIHMYFMLFIFLFF